MKQVHMRAYINAQLRHCTVIHRIQLLRFNSVDVNVITAELPLTKTRLISFIKTLNLLHKILVIIGFGNSNSNTI